MAGKKSVVQPVQGEAKAGTLGRWFERPAPPAAPKATSADNLLFLGRTARVKHRGSECQRSFWTFLQTCVYTKDPARAGEIRKYPAAEYLQDLCDLLILERIQLWDKARRVLATQTLCAFDLWIIAGGQDERWTHFDKEKNQEVATLMLSKENRVVILMAQKLEDLHGSSWYLNECIAPMYHEFEKRGFRERYWPDFPVIDFRATRAEASNGGRIYPVPHGREAGAGATLVHAEECAWWTKARPAWMSLQPTLLGGGHLAGATTANSESWFSDVVSDRVQP